MSLYDKPISLLIQNQSVKLTVHKTRVEITIAMMKKIKSQRNRMRRLVGLPSLPKMDWTVSELNPELRCIEFKLRYGINL
ncbi:MAG: hypothetical protein E6R03_18100 [Hyphomicrobiaceae bacterium]|nr:MAG: hypothetical protein E6R03_18100 [Hyphomicrobiaceae bacterium]